MKKIVVSAFSFYHIALALNEDKAKICELVFIDGDDTHPDSVSVTGITEDGKPSPYETLEAI